MSHFFFRYEHVPTKNSHLIDCGLYIEHPLSDTHPTRGMCMPLSSSDGMCAPTIIFLPTKKSTTSDRGLWGVPYCNPLGGSHEGGGGLTFVELTSAFWSRSAFSSATLPAFPASTNCSTHAMSGLREDGELTLLFTGIFLLGCC